MKKTFQYFLIVILHISISLSGFTQSNYQLTIGSIADEVRINGFVDQDNELIIYGYRTLNMTTYTREGYITRIDEEGNIINQMIFTINQQDFEILPTSIIPDAEQGYIVFALVSDTIDLGLIRRKLRVMKLNHEFCIQYQKDYKIPYTNYCFENVFAQYDLDSSIICTTLIVDTSYMLSSNNTLIYRFNQQGDSLHANRITGHPNYPISMLINPQNTGNYTLFTILYNVTANALGDIVHLNSLFNVLSADSIPRRIYANPSAKWINNDKYITVGKASQYMGPFIPDQRQLGAMILNQQDSVITTKYYGKLDTIEYPASFKSLDFIDNNAIYFGGTFNICGLCGLSLVQRNQPYLLIKTDSLLNTQFEYYYDFNANLNMFSVIATPDGGCIMLGTIYDWINEPDNNHDIFILKVDANGVFTNIKDAEIGKMSEAIIGPNPGTNFINVYIAQQIKEQVVFEMFDFAGKRVIQETLQPTSNTTINTAILQSGMYFYRIRTSQKEIGSGKWVKVN